jgi:hypothetical protein
MLGALRGSVPPFVVCLAVCSCAGRADKFAGTHQEPADTHPESVPRAIVNDFDPARPDEVRFDDSIPYEESRVIATADSIDACSFHGAEDRVAFHHRDARSSTCVDVVLIRVSKGGVAPEGLGLPWDWGVGHMSSYPCTADGQLKESFAPTTLSDVHGNIGMGGGALGLPAALALDLTLSAPVTGSAARVSYVFEAVNLDVTRTCDDATPWAQQPLNLQGEVAPNQFKGCVYIGGYDRVNLYQLDRAAGLCTGFRLIANDEEGNSPAGLSLPANWSVEDMYSYSCSETGVDLADGADIGFTDAVGEVIFAGGSGGLPAFVWLDVTLSITPEDREPCEPGVACAAEPPTALAPRHLLATDAIDMAGDCAGAI